MIKICKLHPNVYGIICGKVTSDNQNYTDDLKHLIKAEGLEQRILFLGEQPTIVCFDRKRVNGADILCRYHLLSL